MSVQVKVTDNSRDFLRVLNDVLSPGLEAVGLQAEKYAKQLCPVDTGRLRNSITHAVDEPEKAVYIGTNVEYAAYVEFGTVKMAERPYLKPAATEHGDEYKRIIEKYMRGT